MPRPARPEKHSVFLNVPFDSGYESQFIALVATTVAVGRTPRCVLEIPETGVGRLRRLLELIGRCSVSIHDLSRVGQPVRFNMPFELGLAFTFAARSKHYSFVVLESTLYRLDKTLSDLKGIDPSIHRGTVKGTIACVCNALPSTHRGPRPDDVFPIYRDLCQVAKELKKGNYRQTIYSGSIFLELVAAASDLCVRRGILKDAR